MPSLTSLSNGSTPLSISDPSTVLISSKKASPVGSVLSEFFWGTVVAESLVICSGGLANGINGFTNPEAWEFCDHGKRAVDHDVTQSVNPEKGSTIGVSP